MGSSIAVYREPQLNNDSSLREYELRILSLGQNGYSSDSKLFCIEYYSVGPGLPAEGPLTNCIGDYGVGNTAEELENRKGKEWWSTSWNAIASIDGKALYARYGDCLVSFVAEVGGWSYVGEINNT